MPGTPNLVSKANLINSFYSLTSRTGWKYYIQQPKVNPTEYHWFFLHFEVKNSHSLGRISQSTVYQLIHMSWGPQFHSLLKDAIRAKPVALLWAKRTFIGLSWMLKTCSFMIGRRGCAIWKNNYISSHQVLLKVFVNTCYHSVPMNGLCTESVQVPLETHFSGSKPVWHILRTSPSQQAFQPKEYKP